MQLLLGRRANPRSLNSLGVSPPDQQYVEASEVPNLAV